MLGATGTIGRATARALAAAGHDVVCLVRPKPGTGTAVGRAEMLQQLAGATVRVGDVTDPASVSRDGFAGEAFDAVVSCLASRKGAPADAWAIDHRAHSNALTAARAAGVSRFVLLSALCVQKPRLAFQHAKLAFERELIASGLAYSIMRPTAYFKSLSGQIERVRAGKPYLLIGDGRLTATKAISDDDLAAYIAGCLVDESRRNRVLPVGGPGDAITPRQQGEELFRLLGKPPRFRQVSPRVLDAIVAGLSALGRVSAAMADKAEFARIGRYYATESMLVLDPDTGRYDASLTPSFGTETLFDYYARVVRGETSADRGDHAVF
ncbi:MAG: NAD(P)H-binding protein [Hyphomicrobiaceae bacterium]